MGKENWLWPFRGGTWRERMLAMPYALELVLIGLFLYFLSWFLNPFKSLF